MFLTNRSCLCSLLIYITCLKGYVTQQSQHRIFNDVDDFLREYNREASEICNRVATTEWNYATNSSDYNHRRMTEQQSIAKNFECMSWKRATTFDAHRLFEPTTRKQLEKILRNGKCGLDEEKFQDINHLIKVMKDAYTNARICAYRPDSHVFGTQYNELNNNLQQGSQFASPQGSQYAPPQGSQYAPPQGPKYPRVHGPQYAPPQGSHYVPQQVSPYATPQGSQYNSSQSSQYASRQGSQYGSSQDSHYYATPQGSNYASSQGSHYDSSQGSQYGSPHGSQYGSSQDSHYYATPQGSNYASSQGSQYATPQGSQYNSPQGSHYDSSQGSHYVPSQASNYVPPHSSQYVPQQSTQYSSSHSNSHCDLRLDPELIKIMEASRDANELLHVWAAWHEKTGPPLKTAFIKYVDLANHAARLQGLHDAGEQMRSTYEDPNFYFTIQDLWNQIQPLYKKLFTYVRKGLVQQYGESIVRRDGPIPAHLLGNMWGENWKNILDVIRPDLPETSDITGEMIRQGYTPMKIFQAAEEFFTSMGLAPMSTEFWRNSILSNYDCINCHCPASAWDFCNNFDFRVKQCTQITTDDFINAHHEMTYIHYYMQYANQPFVYRKGPNPAFQEAMAQAIGLSVRGPLHLQRLGLLTSPIPTGNGNSLLNIEYLLDLALDKLPSMAFSITLEKWRWLVFEKGPIGLNERWWDLRLQYQGLVPPVQRTREHFDAGSKYHVVSDEDYIKHFVATVLQFQIFSELCQASGHVGPFHTCDIYKSREAGRLISDIMQQGASMSSSQMIKVLTRGKSLHLSAQPLMDFFRPLEMWLEQQIRFEPVVGWNSNLDDMALYQYNSAVSFKFAIGVIVCAVLLPLFC